MRFLALAIVAGLFWALPVGAEEAPGGIVLSPAEQAELDKLNAYIDTLREESLKSPQRSRQAIVAETIAKESPGELLSKRYLDTESYVMNAAIFGQMIPSKRHFPESYGQDDVTSIEHNPRFTRALAVLPTLPVAEREELLQQHLKKSLDLYYAAYQRDVLDRSEYFPPGKENPDLPLGPNRGGWSNPDGSPTLFGLRLGALSMIYLASRMEAKALHAEILAVCRREIEQRNFFYDTTRVNERAAAEALNDSLYSRGILAMALKRTAPSDSGVHAVLAETWKADAEKYVVALGVPAVPDDATLHYYPMMSDATFDAAVKAAESERFSKINELLDRRRGLLSAALSKINFDVNPRAGFSWRDRQPICVPLSPEDREQGLKEFRTALSEQPLDWVYIQKCVNFFLYDEPNRAVEKSLIETMEQFPAFSFKCQSCRPQYEIFHYILANQKTDTARAILLELIAPDFEKGLKTVAKHCYQMISPDERDLLSDFTAGNMMTSADLDFTESILREALTRLPADSPQAKRVVKYYGILQKKLAGDPYPDPDAGIP